MLNKKLEENGLILENFKETNVLISKARKEKNISLEKLADMTDMSKSHLEDIESKSVRPTKEELKRLSGALGLPYTRLLFGAGYSSAMDKEPYFNCKGEELDVYNMLNAVYYADPKFIECLVNIALKKIDKSNS